MTTVIKQVLNKPRYGLYLYRASKPEFTGTKAQCRAAVDNLSDAERFHGWLIQPLPEARRARRQHAWAVMGFCFLLAVVGLLYCALRGRLL